MRSDPETACRDCRHFLNRPMALEAALPGLRTLSSAHAAVRSEDGLCGVHDRYVAADYGCSAHEPAVELKRNPASSRALSCVIAYG